MSSSSEFADQPPAYTDVIEYPELRVKKLAEDACLPRRASALAAGYDLYSGEDCEVPAFSRRLVKTNIAIEFYRGQNVPVPRFLYGRIAPRSSLACKHSIDVGAGVVDADYRGNVGVLLINAGDRVFVVKKGDRIAQLILEAAFHCEVRAVSHLTDTTRGDGGFGSTGLRDD